MMDKFRADFNEEFDIFNEIDPPKDMKENIIKAIKREKMKEMTLRLSTIAAAIVLAIIPILTIYNNGSINNYHEANFASVNKNKNNKKAGNIASNVDMGHISNKNYVAKSRSTNFNKCKPTIKINKVKPHNTDKGLAERKIVLNDKKNSDKTVNKVSKMNNSIHNNGLNRTHKSTSNKSAKTNKIDDIGKLALVTPSNETSESKAAASQSSNTTQTNESMQTTKVAATVKTDKSNNADVSNNLSDSGKDIIMDNTKNQTNTSEQKQTSNETDNAKSETILSAAKLAAELPRNAQTVTINYSDKVNLSVMTQNIADIIKNTKIEDYTFENNTFSLKITQTQYDYILDALKKLYTQDVIVQDTISNNQNIDLKIILKYEN